MQSISDTSGSTEFSKTIIHDKSEEIDGPPKASKRQFRMKLRITNEQKADLLEAFNIFDTDGDGKVTSRDLRVAIRALGFEVKPEDIKKLKETTNVCVGIDSLSFDDFLELMEAKMLQQDDAEEIIKFFYLIDDDDTGKVNVNKLRQAATVLGEDVTDEILTEMLMETGSEEIHQEDLIQFIKNATLRLQELYNKR